MLACDSCSAWYHFECAKVPETDDVAKKQFVCTTCLRKKRRNARNQEMQDGTPSKALEQKKVKPEVS